MAYGRIIDDSHRCVGVINSENYTLLDCGASDYGILCQLPPECPEGFRDHRGLCYAVVSSVSNLVEGQLKCEERGASLAIPQTLEDLKFFAWLVRQHAANSGMTSSSGAASDPWQVMLGLNDMLGDFTVDGLFLPDGELLDLANTTNQTLYDYWRVLEVPADEDTFPSLLPVTFLSNSATYAICMLFGPTGCWTEPPSLAANMTRVWEDGAKDYFTTISYKCHRGYFMAGDTKWAEENITCVGILGGWLPGHLFDCIRVEVCDGEVPPAHDLMNSTSDEDFRFLDGSLTYTCPPGMATTEGHVNQTVICYENPDGDGYSFQPFQVDPCNVCQEEPSVGNATTSWNDTQVWMVNDTLSVACIPHHLLDGEPDGELLCTPLGWEERYCYEGCTEAPPTPGANMTQGEGDYSVGSILQYTCDSGYFVPPLQLGEMARSMVEVSCGMDHNWTYVGPLECYRLCHGDPPVAMNNITSTWDCFSRVVGTQVNMSCPTNHVFPDLNDTVTITCEEDEEWTPVYASFLICRQLCPWSKSSEILVNATILHDPTPYWLESEILYGCPDGFESLLGSTTATETCLGRRLDP
ncbi:sushi, von Willebrand factor type A, EGF and pentraxin domain-containing protein 1-like [Scylla paramamosain]|uniref:sushi, von Willebrand factor type A, EGF and pentraxin domain-containing protein 1-like n=1 Tax=Scylla paramamosain TaxID=85552 RepID=UPI003082A45D